MVCWWRQRLCEEVDDEHSCVLVRSSRCSSGSSLAYGGTTEEKTRSQSRFWTMVVVTVVAQGGRYKRHIEGWLVRWQLLKFKIMTWRGV
ncbi:uncharacterized protein HKW66_Vig0170930 [Vigna angularis]|uniref:Uncharacterized protein n=1 Tax=Phaseolus angularis TaxID=3914 RepID=A0A8T0JQI2_PHAAN|nr:uncharacterized protein HKW66_Vig0170930 [Vigna angularis]